MNKFGIKTISDSPNMGNNFLFQDKVFPVSILPQVSKIYNINIDGEIGDAECMQEAILALTLAEEQDQIIININSPGGNISTTDSLMMAMTKCNAPIHAVVSGTCASAATLILMCVDSFELSPFCSFLFHSGSFGTYGKQHDVVTETKFFHEQMQRIMRYHYAGFFNEVELGDLVSNKRELWLTSDEVMERMEKRIVYLTKLNEDKNKSTKETVTVANDIPEKLKRVSRSKKIETTTD